MNRHAPAWFPKRHDMRCFARALVGDDLNGEIDLMEPIWRSLARQICAVPMQDKRPTLHQSLATLGCVETDIQDFEGAVGREGFGAPEGPPIRILSGAQLLDLPALTFLIDEILPEGSSATIIGETNKGKTFIALEMAARIALAGRDVLYIVAEGQRGISLRYNAWRTFYNGGAHLPNLYFITQPVIPTEGDMMEDLYTSMEMVGCPTPALVVFDTLSMCFMGNENDTPDMKRFVDGITALRLRTGAAVMPIHHTGWDTTRMGGNRKLQNAVDVEMRVDQDELGTISLSSTKVRDGERFAPRHFRLQKVDGTESCVLVPTHTSPPIKARLPEHHATILATLEAAGLGGLSFTEVVTKSGIARKPTVSGVLKELQHGGLVRVIGDPGLPGRRYFPIGSTAQTGSVRFGDIDPEPNRTGSEPVQEPVRTSDSVVHEESNDDF